jgi:hypothetical protein
LPVLTEGEVLVEGLGTGFGLYLQPKVEWLFAKCLKTEMLSQFIAQR